MGATSHHPVHLVRNGPLTTVLLQRLGGVGTITVSPMRMTAVSVEGHGIHVPQTGQMPATQR